MSTHESADGPAPLVAALDDHSAEGAEILYSEPAPLIRRSIWLVVALLVTMIAWAFFGHADVIVTAPGVLTPEDDVRRVYAPTEGELEGMLVQEGDPVSRGDELALMRSRNAVELAVRAQQAALHLAEVSLREAQFPATLALLELEATLVANDIRIKQEQLDRRLVAGSEGLRQEQGARLEQARGALERARNDRAQSKRKWDSYRELRGEAVPEVEVENARIAYEQAATAYLQADADLRALESQFIREAAQDRADLENLRLELERLRIAYGRKRMEVEQAPMRLELEVEEASAQAAASRQIRFEDRGGDNVLVVLSPVSGIVTEVAFTQAGEKVQATTPLVTIAPRNSRKMLRVSIAERDRGFLTEGSPVKLKFSAFPYQRYGHIAGTLEYVSPATQRDAAGDTPSYKGFVSLAAEHVEVEGTRRPLRYGMTAVAEIVVRERRLIDMVLDPLRGS